MVAKKVSTKDSALSIGLTFVGISASKPICNKISKTKPSAKMLHNAHEHSSQFFQLIYLMFIKVNLFGEMN